MSEVKIFSHLLDLVIPLEVSGGQEVEGYTVNLGGGDLDLDGSSLGMAIHATVGQTATAGWPEGREGGPGAGTRDQRRGLRCRRRCLRCRRRSWI